MMHCRHTVPDWHRHVGEAAASLPIYAACRLLVDQTGGKPATDPQAIACGYWGRQEACPLYEGPRAVPQPGARAATPESAGIPVDPGAVWPVRPPGGPDLLRLTVIGSALLAIGCLVAAMIGALVAGPGWRSGAAVAMAAVVVGVSIAAHALSALYVWARH